MKLPISAALAAAMLLTVPACKQQEASEQGEAASAASVAALNGTWKADLASVKFEQKPDEYLLKDGSYSCSTCTPPLTVAADGAFHAVADRDYYDSLSIKAVDDKTVEIHRKKGDTETSSTTLTTSDDGNTLNIAFKDMSTPGNTIEGKTTESRVGPAPEGAHAISGQWMPQAIQDYSEDALNVAYQIDGDTVKMSSAGQSYTATLGGPAVPIEGDTGGTTVAVTREGGGIKESMTRGGKAVGEAVVVPAADGQSINVTYTNLRDGSKTMWTGNKQ